MYDYKFTLATINSKARACAKMKSRICRKGKKKKRKRGCAGFPPSSPPRKTLQQSPACAQLRADAEDRAGRVPVPSRRGRGCPGHRVWGAWEGCETPGLKKQRDSGISHPASRREFGPDTPGKELASRFSFFPKKKKSLTRSETSTQSTRVLTFNKAFQILFEIVHIDICLIYSRSM